VPLDRYATNLHSLASQLQQAGVQHVVLATPPPVWEDAPKVTRTGSESAIWLKAPMHIMLTQHISLDKTGSMEVQPALRPALSMLLVVLAALLVCVWQRPAERGEMGVPVPAC